MHDVWFSQLVILNCHCLQGSSTHQTAPWVQLGLTASWVEDAVKGGGGGTEQTHQEDDDYTREPSACHSTAALAPNQEECLRQAAALMCKQVRILGGALHKLEQKNLKTGFCFWRSIIADLQSQNTRVKVSQPKKVKKSKNRRPNARVRRRKSSSKGVAKDPVQVQAEEMAASLSGPEQQALELAKDRLKQLRKRRLAVAVRARTAKLPGNTMERLQQAALEAEEECAALVVALQQAATDAAAEFAFWQEDLEGRGGEEGIAADETNDVECNDHHMSSHVIEQATAEATDAEISELQEENDSMRNMLEELQMQQRLRSEQAHLQLLPLGDPKPWHQQGWADDLWQLDADLKQEALSLTKKLKDGVRQMKFKPTRVIDIDAVKTQLKSVRALQKRSPFKFTLTADWWHGASRSKDVMSPRGSPASSGCLDAVVAENWLTVDCAVWLGAPLTGLLDLLQAAAVLSCTLHEVQLAGVAIDLFDHRLDENQLGDLVKAINPLAQLTHINLADCELTPESGSHLAHILQKCPSVDLSLNPLGCVGVTRMLQCAPIAAGSVRFLDLNDTDLEADGAWAIAAACRGLDIHPVCSYLYLSSPVRFFPLYLSSPVSVCLFLYTSLLVLLEAAHG